MHFNPKGQRPFVSKRLSTACKSHRRPGESRELPFLLREERAQRSGKGTALVPLQTPTKFRCRKRCGTTALVNPPAGNLCAAVQLARSAGAQDNLLRGHQFARHRLRPPLSFAHSGVSRSKPRGSRGCNPLPVFAYFLLGRKYERQIKKTGFALAQNGPFSKGQGLFREYHCL